jgi:hypothetical protein
MLPQRVIGTLNRQRRHRGRLPTARLRQSPQELQNFPPTESFECSTHRSSVGAEQLANAVDASAARSDQPAAP